MSDLVRTKELNISGLNNDGLVRVDVNATPKGGTIQYTELATVQDDAALDDARTIHGIKSVVDKLGVKEARSGKVKTVGASIGDLGLKDYKGILKLTDQVYFKPYHLSDIIYALELPSTTIILRGYDILLESFEFSGRISDLLDSLAGQIYGEAVYDAAKNVYYLTSPDRDLSLGEGELFEIPEDDLVDYETYNTKDSATKNYVQELIRLAKELAKLRLQLRDIEAEKAAETSARQLIGNITFDFGTKEGFREIPPDILVESNAWEEWEFETESGSSKNPNKSASKYFQTVTLKELITSASMSQKGRKKGLRSLYNATLLKQLPFDYTFGKLLFKGYTTNLDCLGMLSKTEYDKIKADHASGDLNELYETEWREVQGVELREKLVLDNGLVKKVYEPFLRFSLSTLALDSIIDTLGSSASDDAIVEALIQLQYGCTGTLKFEGSSMSLIYNGALDCHNRLISSSGQVQLVYISDGVSGPGFYSPVTGMDCDFVTLFKDAQSQTASGEDFTLGGLLDIGRIHTELDSAWQDMLKLAKAQPALAFYMGSAGQSYPKFLVGAVAPDITGDSQASVPSSSIVGVVNSSVNVNIFDENQEPNIPLSLRNYQVPSKTKALLKLKIAVLEDRIELLKRILKRSGDPSDLRSLIRDILTYSTLQEMVKDEALATMQRLRIDLDKAIEAFAAAYDKAAYNAYDELTLTMITPEILPNVGRRIKLPSRITSRTFSITSLSMSNHLTTIQAKYKPS